ncbi:MAG: hypothetical protein M1393_07450 [Candidatus Thermoplasmatota archaeon]|nr:hypothetical protein [Candidatus Thermoplasmatota archaeon]MDA8142374.1 hypothetical protein [Thermoplasmatales archaeon]
MTLFSPLNLFGAAVLLIMMVFYILEYRNPVYTLLFGVMCIGSSAYGFLAGTWPFGVIEGLWAVVALRKYIKLRIVPGSAA